MTLAHLGPEPLEDDFTAAWLSQALAEEQRQLKPLLLDQEFVAGLGNIYVDEALHEAKLHPLLPADRVTKAQAAKLVTAVRSATILNEAIAREADPASTRSTGRPRVSRAATKTSSTSTAVTGARAAAALPPCRSSWWVSGARTSAHAVSEHPAR